MVSNVRVNVITTDVAVHHPSYLRMVVGPPEHQVRLAVGGPVRDPRLPHDLVIVPLKSTNEMVEDVVMSVDPGSVCPLADLEAVGKRAHVLGAGGTGVRTGQPDPMFPGWGWDEARSNTDGVYVVSPSNRQVTAPSM